MWTNTTDVTKEVIQIASFSSLADSTVLEYGDTSQLEASIDQAYTTTAAHLIHLMRNKFALLDHMTALKKYILLGQGDFVSILMEALGPSLERPASTLYRHNLTASLESAIRTSNAQFESADVLHRLDARMLEGSRGTVGWEVFTLEYRLDAPMDVVVTEANARQYLKVFNFLWRLKRVEFALATSWRRSMTGARGILSKVPGATGVDWHQARGINAEMIHFVCQLQYYILFEVIESSWEKLQTAVSGDDCTLDRLIEAHATYMNDITHKGLLGSVAADETSCLSVLHDILKIMLAYKEQMDQLHSLSMTEFAKTQGTATNEHSVTCVDSDLQAATDHGRTLRLRIQNLSIEFRESVAYLLETLAYQPDIEMRFLGVRLNYNEFYKIPRRRKVVKDAIH